jgi:hypothetical protein
MAVIAVATACGAPNAHAAGFSLGAGLHYLRALGDIDTENLDLSKDSFGILGSVQHDGGLLKLEGNVEYIFDVVGTGHEAWQPSAYALIGNLIYGGAGLGSAFIDDDWSEMWYALRAGVNLPLGGLGIDVYTTYQFWSDDDLKQLTGDDLDSITFSGVLRFGM